MLIKNFFKLFLFCGLVLIATACDSQPTAENSPTPTLTPRLEAEIPRPTAPPTNTPLPFPSPTPTPTQVITATPPISPPTNRLNPFATVTAARLNIHQGPGFTYGVLRVATQGQQLAVTGIDSTQTWLQVQIGNGLGWLRLNQVRLDQQTTTRSLPVVTVAPTIPTVAPVPPQPTTPPDNGLTGRFVFMTGSGGTLYTIKANGDGLRALATGIIDPAVSPNGREVAFTRWDGAEFGALFILDLATGQERVIANDIRQPKSPAWSPDGSQIMLSFQHGGLRDPVETCRFFDIDDGVNLPDNIQITRINPGEFELTICFIPNEDLKWRLRLVEVATGAFEDVLSEEYAYTPTWDPQQPWRVVYDGNDGLTQLDVTRQWDGPLTEDVRDTGPVFSPDGNLLAITYRQHGNWDIHTFSMGTGERTRITKPPILADPQYNSASPAWSPDGRQIAFVTDRRGAWEFWVMNADGRDPRPLFSEAIQAQFSLRYDGMHERMINWVAE